MGEKENRLKISRKHIGKAEQNLKAAKLLHNNDMSEDAISRAYYATYHATYAMLNSIGENPKTHKGLLNLLYIHFVEENRLEKSMHKRLNQLLNYRVDADYGIIPQFDEEDADKSLETAAESIKVAKEWLDNFDIS